MISLRALSIRVLETGIRIPRRAMRQDGGTCHGILKENGLGPHRVGTFRVSRDVVGLCIDPPDHAVVLSAEESEDANATGPGERANRIQALGRTRKPLPVKPGHAVTRTHDCRRHGTTCLLAARDVATGTARRSSSPSPTLSPRGSHPEPRCMSSSTPSRRTGRPRSARGRRAGPTGRSASPRPRRPGRTPSRGSSRGCPGRGRRMRPSTRSTNASRRPRDASRTTMPTTPVRSAGAGSRRTSSRRAREDTGDFGKWHQMHESNH